MVDDFDKEAEKIIITSNLAPEQRKMKAAKKKGRKSNYERKMLNRPHRVPVSGERDILVVHGIDETKFSYRWVHDVSENGTRIFKYRRGGWEFVPAEEHQVGQELVFKSSSVGSVIRYPANRFGEYLYFMYIDKELYEQDQAAKQHVVDDYERSMTQDRGPDDPTDGESLYGGGNVSKKYTPALPK